MNNCREKIGSIVKIWRRMDTIGSVIMLIVLGCLVISFIGIPKEIDEIVDACVYTEHGETLHCEIQIKGEVTNHPFRNYSEYSICAYRDNILLSEMQYNTAKQQYGYCQQYRFTGIKDILNDVLVIETDLNYLYPNMETQRCMIVAPAQERDTAMDIVNHSGEYDAFKAPFSWVGDNF